MYDPHLYDENGVNLAGIKSVIVTNNKTRRGAETGNYKLQKSAWQERYYQYQ